MHLFQLSPDQPGQLLFRYPWLPQWLVYNQEMLDIVYRESLSVLPKDIKVSEITEEHWNALDQAAVKAMTRSLPYVTGLDKILEAIMAAGLDASKAPPRKLRKGAAPESPNADPRG